MLFVVVVLFSFICLIAVLSPCTKAKIMSRRTQLTLPHCSWASLPNNYPRPILSEHSCAINCQMFFLKRENGCRNIFMTKSPRKKCWPYGRSRVRLQQEIIYEFATDWANAPVLFLLHVLGIYMCTELVPILHTRENIY